LLLPDIDATRDLAASLAPLARRGDVIGLVGPLGAGKTTFARSFIGALGGTDLVPSPTWSLVEQHAAGAGDVWHFDLHRLERAEGRLDPGPNLRTRDESFAPSARLGIV